MKAWTALLDAAYGPLVGVVIEPRDARDCYYMRLRTPLEARRERHRAIDHAPEVDPHDPLEVPERNVFKVITQEHSSVVDQEIDLSVMSLGLGSEGENRLTVSDVQHVGRNTPTGVPEHATCLFEPGL